jgi:hypothetical protein
VLQAFPAVAKVNEVRELAGREPLPEKDGDLHLVTLGASAVRSLSELEDKAPAADPILPPVADPNAPPADDTPPEDQAA